jgi:hypothetical protein
MNKKSSLSLLIALCSTLAACTAGRAPHVGGDDNAALATPQSDVPAVPPASAAMVERSCALVPASERTQCPVRRTLVIAARELRTPLDPKGHLTTSAGAVVYMVAAPGLTDEWLGHLIECYQTEVSVSAVANADRETCPIDPATEYAVNPTRSGFAVALHSSDHASAHHIYELSERLASAQVAP